MSVVKKKVLPKRVVKKLKKEEVKLPTRWITHTIEDTNVDIDEFPDKSFLREEFYVGEWCRYVNCTFNISLEDTKIIYFDECIFENCKFIYRNHDKISIQFIACDFNDTEFDIDTTGYMEFNNCTIKGLKPKFNTIFRVDQIIFDRCYTITDLNLTTTVTDDIGFIGNLNYKNVDLTNVNVPVIRFKDVHLLKYWDSEIKLAQNQVIEYDRIGEEQ